MLDHTQQHAEEAAGREVMIQVRQPGYVRTNKNLVPGMGDGGIRTAGSDKHNEPQQYCAYGCVVHVQRVGGSVETMGSVRMLSVAYLVYVLTVWSQLMRA